MIGSTPYDRRVAIPLPADSDIRRGGGGRDRRSDDFRQAIVFAFASMFVAGTTATADDGDAIARS